jgi:C-terminal processing protease CtpA/Prc
MKSQIFLSFVIIFIFTGCGTTLKKVTVSDEAVRIEKEKQEDLAFSRFMDKQNRLYSISYPLLVASGELFTDEVRPAHGFMLHDKELYKKTLGKEYENVAVRHGIEEHVTVRYVYPESSADLADLRVGDRILTINEKPLEGENAIDVMNILHKLEYPEERALELLIEREGQKKSSQ